ncbi:MAG: hypothetical protein RR521_12320, partial [Clostridia bacterium]
SIKSSIPLIARLTVRLTAEQRNGKPSTVLNPFNKSTVNAKARRASKLGGLWLRKSFRKYIMSFLTGLIPP